MCVGLNLAFKKRSSLQSGLNALLRAELTSNVIARFEQVLLEYTRKSHELNRKKEELSWVKPHGSGENLQKEIV